MNDKLIRIYLNDHLAGATAGSEVIKRCLSNNSGSPLGEFLERLHVEVLEDRADLIHIIETLGLPVDRYKVGAGWIAEKAGRLKLNGQLTGYSDLSRVVELEGIKIGVEGKLSLWRALKDVSGYDTRLAVVDFDRLIKRAEAQLTELEEHRLEAANRAFV